MLNTMFASFDINLPGSVLRTHVESLASLEIHQTFSKPCLVNLISKDSHLRYSRYLCPMIPLTVDRTIENKETWALIHINRIAKQFIPQYNLIWLYGSVGKAHIHLSVHLFEEFRRDSGFKTQIKDKFYYSGMLQCCFV